MESILDKRLFSDQACLQLLTEIYQNRSFTAKQLKSKYINPMRISLWLADETYHTFSAYFHVIHCCDTPNSNLSKTAINWLLEQNHQKYFINICRVSILENFAFMFHYLKRSSR